MNCQVCHISSNIKGCSKCHVSYYCSVDCQKQDWTSHKPICQAITNTTVSNPWFSKKQRHDQLVPLKIVSIDEMDLLKDANSFMDYIKKPDVLKYINTYRGRYGGTFLHQAVKYGHFEVVKFLIEKGAYINATDWMVNTPFYYACSCPDVPNRMLIVEYLITKGAYIIFSGGYSGMRPAEAARHYGFVDVADYVEVEERLSPFNRIRHLINKADHEIPDKLRLAVLQFIDLEWRKNTITHMIQPNREKMFQNSKPRSDVKLQTIDDVEDAYKECCWRHDMFTKTMNKLKNED